MKVFKSKLLKKASLISLLFSILFIYFQATGIQGADSGGLVAAACTGGMAHPPGYPVYTLLAGLLCRLNFLTPAWRVGLLSSVPHAVTLGLVYALLYRLTASDFAAVNAVLVLAGSRVFYFYSLTAEVFAMLSLFIAIVSYAVYGWLSKHKTIYLSLIIMSMGLSIGHHHLIVFSIPPILLAFYYTRLYINQNNILYYIFFRSSLWVLIGFLTYIYTYFADRLGSVINWFSVSSLKDILVYIFRVQYGTFRSGSTIGETSFQRLLSLKSFFIMSFDDFGIVVLLLMLIGILYVIMNKNIKKFGLFFIFSWLMYGPFYFFYASYLVGNAFVFGLMERFLIPSYIYVAIFTGIGTFAVGKGIIRLCPIIKIRNLQGLLSSGFLVLITLFITIKLGQTVWLFQALRYDRTADNLGNDILNSASESAILVLHKDHELFPAQYMRYVSNVRSDTTLLYTSRLADEKYLEKMSKKFSFDYRSLSQNKEQNIILSFVEANIGQKPLYFNENYDIPNYELIPEGFLMRVYEKNNLPEPDAVIRHNQMLWEKFHNPSSGFSVFYSHPLYNNFQSIYAEKLNFSAVYAINHGKHLEAIWFLDKAVLYKSDIKDKIYKNLGISHLALNNCDLSGFYLNESKLLSPTPDIKVAEAWYAYVKICNRGKEAESQAETEYLNAKKLIETPLR